MLIKAVNVSGFDLLTVVLVVWPFLRISLMYYLSLLFAFVWVLLIPTLLRLQFSLP